MTPISTDLSWGIAGARALAADCDVVVLVDVLSFTTSVSVAVSGGATVRARGTDEGATIAAEFAGPFLIAASLRNATAVAKWLHERGGRVGVVAAGERDDAGGWRPAYEDAVGAGAVLSQLGASSSPQVAAAISAFREAEPQLRERLLSCRSGAVLVAAGQDADVVAAAELDADNAVPLWQNGAFTAAP